MRFSISGLNWGVVLELDQWRACRGKNVNISCIISRNALSPFGSFTGPLLSRNTFSDVVSNLCYEISKFLTGNLFLFPVPKDDDFFTCLCMITSACSLILTIFHLPVTVLPATAPSRMLTSSKSRSLSPTTTSTTCAT